MIMFLMLLLTDAYPSFLITDRVGSK